MSKKNKALSLEQCEELLQTLQERFEKNMNRHQGLDWTSVQAKLETKAEKLWSLNEMESTGGEPDVVGYDENTGSLFFMIVQRRARKVAEVFVTIVKHWSQGRSTNQKILR